MLEVYIEKILIYGVSIRHRPNRYLRTVMNELKAIYHALGKDISVELRRGHALGGLLVFVLATVFIIYISLQEIPVEAWLALYWVAFLFLSVYAILNSFAAESRRRYMYYYTLMSPEVLFIAKCVFNALVLMVLGLIMYGAMHLLSESPVIQHGLFITAILIGAVSHALAFTFTSAIAIKSDNSATLMAILSFPIIIPILLSLIKLSKSAVELPGILDASDSFLTLGAIDLVLVGLGLLLFPYLWKS